MKYKKDNKLPNTKNVRRKTNPAGVTTIIEPKKGGGGGGGGQGVGGNTNQTNTGGSGGGQGQGGNTGGHEGGASDEASDMSSGHGYPGAGGGPGQLPHLPPGSLKQEPGQYGLTSL